MKIEKWFWISGGNKNQLWIVNCRWQIQHSRSFGYLCWIFGRKFISGKRIGYHDFGKLWTVNPKNCLNLQICIFHRYLCFHKVFIDGARDTLSVTNAHVLCFSLIWWWKYCFEVIYWILICLRKFFIALVTGIVLNY